MKKDLTRKEIELAIVEIAHNLECVNEAQEQATEERKGDFTAEKTRLTKLLNKYIKMEKEVG